jgi:nicotinamidase-related amidase
LPAAFALRKGSKYGRHSSMAEIDLGANYIHICVDVQNVFAKDTEWWAPWLVRVLPAIEAISEKYSDRTIFTRFIPPRTPEEASGAWQAYYQRWRNMTRDRLASDLLDLVPALQRLVPPARIVDKRIYSPWLGSGLHHILRNAGIDTIIVSGGETDVCVLATVMGAIDLGYRVILPVDAVFGSADETHDAVLSLYTNRFGQQLASCSTQDLLDRRVALT